MNFDFTHFLQLFFFFFFFFFSKIAILSKMYFYQTFEVLKLFLGLIISFGTPLVCKLGNKKFVLNSVSFLVEFFSIFQFSVFTENRNFHFFLKSFPQVVLVLSHTFSNSFRL